MEQNQSEHGTVSDENAVCVICNTANEQQLARLGVKGCQSLEVVSKTKGDCLSFVPGQLVHLDCRRNYTRHIHRTPDKLTPNKIVSPKTRTSLESKFDYMNNCLFCGTAAKISHRKRGRDVFFVRTLEFESSIRDACKTRNDDWSNVVLGRLEYAQDLPAVEARYHQSCSANFRYGYHIPKEYQRATDLKRRKLGRPPSISNDNAFLEVIQYFEDNESMQITVSDLVNKMKELSGNDAYSCVYMKKRIIEHFGDSVIIAEVDGRADVVTYKSVAHAILHSFYHRQKTSDCDSEKLAIIKTAGKFILNDIKKIEMNKEYYPTAGDLTLESSMNNIPSSLQVFLDQLIDSKKSLKKKASIGQAIIQASAPRTVMEPLQIGLGIQLHHHFGSKFLIDVLNSMGFCSSYEEVQRFECSAAAAQDTMLTKTPDQFVQFVCDNVDHNIDTLDGHNTFHGMGIIAALTPKVERSIRISRIHATKEDLVDIGKINISYYKQPSHNMEMMIFRKLVEFTTNIPHYEELDFLHKVARPLRPAIPGWSGFMQTVQLGSYPGQSDVVFLPMIDLNPSDMNCIYSTLKFVAEQSRLLNATPIVTFDQPLYWKAFNLVSNELDDSELKQMIVRLGPFHTEMSFLGCIGKVMENSGLAELLSTVYATNTVGHMLSGKAVARAVRGHMLVSDALNTLLLELVFPELHQRNMEEHDTEPQDEHYTFVDENNNLEESKQLPTEKLAQYYSVVDLLDNIISKEIGPESLNDNALVADLMATFESKKLALRDYRTAKLWLQYIEMIDILKRFIAAERMGQWDFHLKTMQEMLSYFAAAGHNLYLKSGYIYLQEMSDLARTNPLVHQALSQGHHVIRRSDRLWAGLSSDLIIEQMLMRSLKSSGGLTRGRGMSESQRSLWLLSMPAIVDINKAMQEFSGQTYGTSEQHKEASTSRIQRDTKDRDTFLNFLRERNPFSDDASLRNIETGAVADINVNVDTAKTVGQSVIAEMENQRVLDYSFKRSHQVITLGTKNNLKVSGEEISIDPQLLFQRLIAVSDDSFDNVEELFSFELCSFPSALFDSSGLLRVAQKASLATALVEIGGEVDSIPNDIFYVLDGGSLLQRLSWKYGTSFMKILEDYGSLVEANYGTPHVVFDGYLSGPTTKDVTHERRTKGVVGTKVQFDGRTPFKTKKDTFLANKENKQNFIYMLGDHLVSKGCQVTHAEGDADLSIVKSAIKSAETFSTAVVGEDTDLLVLLCYYANIDHQKIYFKSDIKTGLKKKKIWDIYKTKQNLGPDNCHLLPFIHAFSGCDTTSRVYGIGKGIILKKLVSDSNFKQYADYFLRESSHSEIERAGEAVFVELYGGKSGESLNQLRYRKFVHKANVSKSVVQVQTLPPTQVAAKFHSFRCYLQVQTWIGKELNPLEWGWCKIDNKLTPIKTTLTAAPERLLKVVRCSCKVNCDTKRCSCRKHGLSCSAGCTDCKGTSCSNVFVQNDDEGDFQLLDVDQI